MRFILSLLIASVAAALLTMVADRRGFEELAERAAIAYQANAPGTKCPLSREYIDSTDLSLLSICLTHGLGAFEAAQRYPASAAKVFALYGEGEAFRQVLDQYGHQVIPVIASFLENGSVEFQVRQTIAGALQQMWAGQTPTWEVAKLTPEQIGLIAIDHIAARGHEMLAEFEIVDDIAKQKPVTSLVLGAKDLFLGGVVDVEKILVRGERLPTWKEVGLAAVDVTIVVGGIGAISKAARVGGRTAAEKSTARLMAEGAYGAISGVVKTGERIAPVAFVYVAFTRPDLIASAGGWIAEQFGIYRSVGIFVVYLIGISLVLQFLRPLLWCGRIVLWSAAYLLAFPAKAPARSSNVRRVVGTSD